MKIIYSFLLFFVLAVSVNAQRTVSGVIADVNGLPLIGANVLAEGTAVGTITDIDGSFSMNVPEGVEKLVVSYTGYDTKSIDIIGLSSVNITLAEGQVLDEVVVTALGNTRNSREVVYANQTVSSEDLKSGPKQKHIRGFKRKSSWC